jgi:hypothetical protein
MRRRLEQVVEDKKSSISKKGKERRLMMLKSRKAFEGKACCDLIKDEGKKRKEIN